MCGTPFAKNDDIRRRDMINARDWIQQAGYQNDGLEGSVARLLARVQELEREAGRIASLEQLITKWRSEYVQPYGNDIGNRTLLRCANDLEAVLRSLSTDTSK